MGWPVRGCPGVWAILRVKEFFIREDVRATTSDYISGVGSVAIQSMRLICIIQGRSFML